jgi:ssDNA-binding Zn-finger/Zn-ribbon topoisomerase 1
MSEAKQGLRENIRQAASRLRDEYRFVGEIACPNCDHEAWEIDIPGRGIITICPYCGFGLTES